MNKEDIKQYYVMQKKFYDFLCQRCMEYNKVYYGVDVNLTIDDVEDFELEEHKNIVNVWFYGDNPSYKLPYDILFDNDFVDKLTVKYEAEMEQLRKDIEERRAKQAKRNQDQNLFILEELIKRYPTQAIAIWEQLNENVINKEV